MAESTDPASSGDAVGRRTFSTSFRGFDQAEVRAYLRVLAGEFSALRERVAELDAALSAAAEPAPAPPMTLDIATVTSALGEETARVLRTAQEAAEDLRTRAEDGAARTLKEAHEEAARTLKEAQDEADRLRKEAQEAAERLQEAAETLARERTAEADRAVAAATESAAALHSAAELVLSERTAEAEAAASTIREEAAQAAAQARAEAEEASTRVRKEAEEVATRLRKDAESETAAAIAKAVEEGRDMLGQARAARERVLSDLARRRKVAANQVELLRSGRERLQASVETARAESDRILEDLKRSDEEARRATDQAARQTPNSPALGSSGRDGEDQETESDEEEERAEEPTAEAARAAGTGPPDRGTGRSPSDQAEPVSSAGPTAVANAVVAAGEPEPAPTAVVEVNVVAEREPVAATPGEPGAAGPAGSPDPAPIQPADGHEGATGAGPVAPTSIAGPVGGEPAAPSPSTDSPAEVQPGGDPSDEDATATPPPPAASAAPAGEATAAPPPAATSAPAPGATTAPAAAAPALGATAAPAAAPAPAATPRPPGRGPGGTGSGPPAMGAEANARPDVDLTRVPDVDLRVPPPGGSVSGPVEPPPGASPPRPPYPHDPVPAADLPPAATGAPVGRVDQLFAKIRADRAPKTDHGPVQAPSDLPDQGGGRPRATARGRSTQSRPEPVTRPAAETPNGESAGAMVATAGAVDVRPTPDDRGLEAPRSDEDESYLQRRDTLIEAALARAVRITKRFFADDQNAALDRLRTLRVANRTVDAVLGEQSAQVDALAGRVAPSLADGATAGARLGAGDATAPIDPSLVLPVAERLATALFEPFRRRLSDLFDDAEERGSVTVDRLNGVYREWRGRIEEAVGDAMTEAVSVGFAAAVAEGSPVRWVVEDVGGPCADCDDNALAGAGPFGSPFPTGQLAPPAHPGCRCVLAPAET